MMKSMMTVIAAFSALAFAAELPLDKDHASVGFSVTHMVISQVQGSFTEFDGSLTVEDGELKGAKAEIQVKSINTANRRRDEHLRSADFFDAETHPVMTFESTKVEEGKVTGNLTIKGVTREVVLDSTFTGPATDPWGNTRYGLTGKTTINRTEFGLTWNQALETGGVLVGEDVEITINVQVIAGN